MVAVLLSGVKVLLDTVMMSVGDEEGKIVAPSVTLEDTTSPVDEILGLLGDAESVGNTLECVVSGS